jgi:hypothetical protein
LSSATSESPAVGILSPRRGQRLTVKS